METARATTGETEMKTYTIAMIGDMLAATAVDGDDAMMSKRLAELPELPEDETDKTIFTTGLTLYATVADAEDDGAEVVYSGCDMGWLEDASGAMAYMAAGRKPGQVV